MENEFELVVRLPLSHRELEEPVLVIPQCAINPIIGEYSASPVLDYEIYAYKGIFWIVDEEDLTANIPYMFRIPVNSRGEGIIYDGICPRGRENAVKNEGEG